MIWLIVALAIIAFIIGIAFLAIKVLGEITNIDWDEIESSFTD